MAVRNVLEEKIRLYVESAGDEELKQLVSGFGDLGDTADFQSNIARKAMERLAGAIDNIGRIEAFDKLKRDLVATESNLEQAQKKAQALFKEFAGADVVSPAVARQQQQARKAVQDLTAAAQGQRQQLQRLRGELSASGIDTRRLGTAQGEMKREMAAARATLASSVSSLRQLRQEQSQAAHDIPRTNERIARSYDGIGGAVTRLRSLVAPVLAFLSFRTAAAGVKALADVQQKAEDARRALAEMYGSQDAGNAAFARLEALAKRNGLAIGDVVEQAKRLKAFGIDPLNGSLQALVDQNAAAGGSMEDLSGKVLALGQAWAKQKLQGEEILQLVERGVPVWDLLQKATGKNVQELQKLSEKGKLGREVIQQLYEEIGKANSGAANRALGSLSGLISQTSARWLEFKQDIVDAGLGAYLKQQFTELLESTGGMDALARRVSEGIVATLQAVKNFGQQVAPVAKGIGAVSLALARNAEALVALAKVYAVLKIASWARAFSVLARAKMADAAASNAAAAAAGRHATAATGLGGILRSLPRKIGIGIALLGVDWSIQQVQELTRVLKDREDASKQVEAAERSGRQLQQEQLLLGQQLQQLYREYSGTAVKSAEDLSRLTRGQAGAYRLSLENARQYFGGVIREARAAGDAQAEATATERWRALGAAVVAVDVQIAQMGRTASTNSAVAAFVDATVKKFDELIAKGKSAAVAINGAFDGIDLTSAEGLEKAVGVLDRVAAGGELAAKAVEAELVQVLAKVSAVELPKVEAAAIKAFGAGSAEAQRMADTVDKVRLAKLGVDLEAIKTGFSAAGREVVTAFTEMVAQIDDLGLTAEQSSSAIAQAFDNAFRQASTKRELESLKKALQSAVSAGDLSFAEFQKRIAQTDAQLAALAGTAGNLPNVLAGGVENLSDGLQELTDVADDTSDGVEQVEKGVERVGKGADEAGEDVKEMSVALTGLSDELTKAYVGMNKYATDAGMFARNISLVSAAWREQDAAVASLNEGLDQQLAKLDPLSDRLQELKGQYPFVEEAKLRAVAEKQQRLEDETRNRRDEAKRLRDEAREAREEATQAAAGADAGSGNGPVRGNGPVGGAPLRDLGSITVVLPDGSSSHITTDPVGAAAIGSLLEEIGRAGAITTRRRR